MEPRLPTFTPIEGSNFRWGEQEGEDLAETIRSAYYEVTTWRRNIFLVPSGKAGKEFVRELTRLINAYAQATALESVAMFAVMTACTLLLQKPFVASKARDHVSALERRLKAWHDGDIEGLLREGRAIQSHLNEGSSKWTSQEAVAKAFAKLMMAGKVKAALRYLSDNQNAGLVSLDEQVSEIVTVREILKEKHPTPREVNADALLSKSSVVANSTHPVIFESITGDMVRSVALQTQGSAGPSGVDAAGWRRLLTSFNKDSKDLCGAVAAFARRLCSNYVNPGGLQAFLACRLIPLNKNPGVRPIGVGEVLRRIIGKAVLRTVHSDVLKATGTTQLCAGHEAGCEIAFHAMQSIFQDDKTEAILLVDASNAFNNLNRQVALLNIHETCPAIATILTNCYRSQSPLFVQGEMLLSCEGTTQGDPLAMAMFALASIPLIQKVETPGAKQAWFADDAACGGRLVKLRDWWERLNSQGPMYGYFPNCAKTNLVVKVQYEEKARSVFHGTKVNINVEGKQYLGRAIGTDAFMEAFLESKVDEWVNEVQRLSEIAKSQPHSAYAAFGHGLVGRWTYQCKISDVPTRMLQRLEKVIQESFLPNLTGQPSPNAHVRKLLALPARLGGIGIINPVWLSTVYYQQSVAASKPLVQIILDQEGDVVIGRAMQKAIKAECTRGRWAQQKASAEMLIEDMPADVQRYMRALSEKGTSSWLTALPLERHGFALHKGAFRDAVCLRYGWPLPYTPTACVCGAKFDPDHLLICKYGGYPTLRHIEIRDITASMLNEVCQNVSTEPRLQPLTGEVLGRSANTDDEARVDKRAKNFWSDCGE